ncbi:MAG: hypothetical protein ACU0CY_07805 [Maritimibacter harenae]
MTALTEYDRLEASGLWRADPGAQRVDVIVSIGDATLTLSDMAERALAHWSLAAVHRLNPGQRPAEYAPSEDPEETEHLEIADEDMIAAIERVRKAIARRRPRSGRLRFALTATVALVLLLLAVTWLPGALTRQTAALLPPETRAAVGQQLFTRIQTIAGAPCETPRGRAALNRLGTRVLGPDAPRLHVLQDGVDGAEHLPGRIILLDAVLIEAHDEPDAAAGYLLAEALRATRTDPMKELLDRAGLWATMRMLTTGTLSDAVLDAHARHLLTTPQEELRPAALLPLFEAARIRSTPYAFAVDASGERTLPLIEADPVPVAVAEPLLPDDDWVSLQSICGT